MSTTRAASKGISSLSQASLKCCRRPFATLLAPQRHALIPKETPVPRRISSTAFSPQKSSSLGQSVNLLPTRRTFWSTPAVAHGDWSPPTDGEELYVTFLDKDGDEHKIAVSKGDNLLDVAQANDIEMEGACGGSCACSTCHVIIEDEKLYDLMSEPDDDENDMLDLAFGLTETSRLGCQVIMSKELDGLRVKLPSMTRNMQASDFSKKNERSD